MSGSDSAAEDEWFDGSSDESSPFDAPESSAPPPQRITNDPSVFEEPWMRTGNSVMHGRPESPEVPGEADPESSVWDEPGLSLQLSGDIPADGLTWHRWADQNQARTSLTTSLGVTLLVAVCSGLLAILGTLIIQAGGGNAFVLLAIGAPIVEETMKIGLTIWVVEKRPWLFRWRGQILLCGMCSGMVFAAIENVIYLTILIPNPSAAIVTWRWTVCVLLHTGCSSLAALGATRVWSESWRLQRQPQLSDGAAWIVAAMLCHGIYNTAALVLAWAGHTF